MTGEAGALAFCDVNAFLGAYPYRRIPGTTPDHLLTAMDRVGIAEAWVSHLPGIFWRDPSEGNLWLSATTEGHPRLHPVLAVQPRLPGWTKVLETAAEMGTPAVRCDPLFAGLDPVGDPMRRLAQACGERQLPLVMAVRLEDVRQRHPLDRAADLSASAIRFLLRSHPDLRLVITHADRECIEQVHFGSTEAESSRVWWDISWIWGPPEDHLEMLVATVGRERFVFGTGQPLRLPEASRAKWDLLPDPTARVAIASGNLRTLRHGPHPPPG